MPLEAEETVQGTEEKHSRLRVKQLICESLNGMRITETILAADLLTLDRDESPMERVAAGSWSIGIREQSQGEVCC